MQDVKSRIEAITKLVENEDSRRERSSWKAIFDSTEYSPSTDDPSFEHDLLELLKNEAAAGYRRKDKLLQSKNRRRSSYTPSQMYITSKIGRYIFAVMGWHNSIPGTKKHEVLVELSEAFNFAIDPKEMQLQQVSEAERKEILEAEEDQAYSQRNWAMVVAGFGAVITIIFFMIRKFG